jgi:hypothetical protein
MLTAVGYTVLLVAALALRVVPALRRRVASVPDALAAAMRTTSGRVGVLLAWLWIGVHFLAR